MSVPRERPIIFSGLMVRAIMEDRKTQTRRMIKPQPENPEIFGVSPILGQGVPYFADGKTIPENNRRYCVHAAFNEDGKRADRWLRCPYGKPGDRLWVREPWRPWNFRDGGPIVIQYADGAKQEEYGSETLGYEGWYERLAIQAADECRQAGCNQDGEGLYTWEDDKDCPTKWRPSIHMPRWASRLTLEVTEICVERGFGQDTNPWVWVVSFCRVTECK